jgi:hypothetical protein
MNNRHTVAISDRIFSFLSYVSAGWIGLIVLILLYFMKRSSSRFLRFNVFQAIFISLLFYVIAMGLGYILKLLSFIPFVNLLIANITLLFTQGAIFDYSIIQICMLGLVIYLSIMSLLGKMPRIYWVSKIIDRQV